MLENCQRLFEFDTSRFQLNHNGVNHFTSDDLYMYICQILSELAAFDRSFFPTGDNFTACGSIEVDINCVACIGMHLLCYALFPPVQRGTHSFFQGLLCNPQIPDLCPVKN